MDMHRAARLELIGLGHERRVDVVTQRRVPHRALEKKRMIGELQRRAVIEVDLDLRHALFVDQAVDADFLALAKIVDVLEQRIEFVDRVDRIGLASRLRPPGFAGRRQQRIIGVEVFL